MGVTVCFLSANAMVGEEEFHKTYSMFDYDENGIISTDHLGTVMRALGVNPSESELQDLIIEFDVEEFLRVMGVKPKSE